MVGSAWLRLGLLLGAVGAVLVVLAVRGVPTLEEVRVTVGGAGAWAPVLFVALVVLATVSLLPISVFTLLAGVLFGPFLGVVLVWVGAVAGALACFGLGRVLSRPALLRLTGRGRTGSALLRLEDVLSRRGLLAVLGVRLVPVVPFGPSSYLAGATSLRLRDFLLGTAIGTVPGVVVYTVLGGSLSEPTSPAFLASAGALVVLLGLSTLLARRS